jgi:hypothetical protein
MFFMQAIYAFLVDLRGVTALVTRRPERHPSFSGRALLAERSSADEFVHDLAGRLRCSKCAKAGRRPSATLLQLAFRARHDPSEP